MFRRRLSLAVAVVTGLTLTAGTAIAAPMVFADLTAPKNGTAVSNLPAGQDNPMISNGVAIGANTAIYKTSGLGPTALNVAAAGGTEQRYIDTAVFPNGVLPPGVTITEAQGINVLRRIGENLAQAGLDYDDVITMRVFLQNPAGTEKADFDGWNRAYRQFFANTSLSTGAPLNVSLGSAPPAAPMVVNPARPSRFSLEIENLPVNGWLVEVEVDAVYPSPSGK